MARGLAQCCKVIFNAATKTLFPLLHFKMTKFGGSRENEGVEYALQSLSSLTSESGQNVLIHEFQSWLFGGCLLWHISTI